MKLLTKSVWTDPGCPGVEFDIRPLTMREALEFRALAREHGGESVEVHEYLFAHGLVGWRGIEGEDGQALPATAENAMGLDFNTCNKLALRISVISGLLPDPDAEKNSQSPSPSSDNEESSTAALADGAAIADPEIPLPPPSGG